MSKARGGLPEKTRAVLLVGGLGTRLRSVVASKPKPLASVGDSPFLELLVRQLRAQGIRQVVMCTGYRGNQIEEIFGDGRTLDVSIEYSQENSPLGTAGAVGLARNYLLESSDFLVANGDSFLEVGISDMFRFHREHRGLVSMAVVQSDDAGRFGTVQVDDRNRVIGFSEKTGRKQPGVINGGVYVFSRGIFDFIPEGPSSLERDVFPRVLNEGIYAVEQRGMFIDIGTPQDYARAQELRDALAGAAQRQDACGVGEER